jgi:hypothetical protein
MLGYGRLGGLLHGPPGLATLACGQAEQGSITGRPAAQIRIDDNYESEIANDVGHAVNYLSEPCCYHVFGHLTGVLRLGSQLPGRIARRLDVACRLALASHAAVDLTPCRGVLTTSTALQHRAGHFRVADIVSLSG